MLLISLSAVIGYILNIPSLYYNWIGFTAMAFHTALLFFLISISFILMGINNRGLNGNGNNGNNNHNHNHNNGIKIKAISENNL
jgi:hypothetical protein